MVSFYLLNEVFKKINSNLAGNIKNLSFAAVSAYAPQINIVSAYAPQVNNSMEEKNDFWEDLDGLIESISKEERIVLGADLNGHVGEGNIGDEEIMRRHGAGTRNKEGSMVVDFGKRMNLAIVNT